MSTKLIAVVGATGAQGGGLARAILDDPSGEFALRALTRNPDGQAAQALKAKGAEVVQVDLDDPASVRSAFGGAWGAFCLTNFWEHFSAEKEMAQARNMAEAAKEAGLRHVIWSTFEDTREYVPLEDDRMPTLQDHYKVPHFDGKGAADQYFRDAGVPTTFLLTSGYFDNFIHLGWGPQKGEDGRLVVVFPTDDAKIPFIASEDIGRCAFGIFQRSDEYIGRTVGVAGDHVSGNEIASALSQALGREIAYQPVPPDVYRGFDFPGADDIGNMFQFKRDFTDIYREHRSVDESRRLNPQLKTLDAWLEENASRIPLPE